MAYFIIFSSSLIFYSLKMLCLCIVLLLSFAFFLLGVLWASRTSDLWFGALDESGTIHIRIVPNNSFPFSFPSPLVFPLHIYYAFCSCLTKLGYSRFLFLFFVCLFFIWFTLVILISLFFGSFYWYILKLWILCAVIITPLKTFLISVTVYLINNSFFKDFNLYAYTVYLFLHTVYFIHYHL